jgi:hypothetical protein
LRKIRFGRKSRVYRMMGTQYETDQKERKFVEVFSLERGEDAAATKLKCLFLPELPEANANSLSNADLGRVSKNLKLSFVPPALERRSEETGIPPQQYIMEAFFKGKTYSQILDASVQYRHPHFLELDFVLECSTAANNLLKRVEEEGEADWAAVDREWQKLFRGLVGKELKESAETAAETGQEEEEQKAAAPAHAEKEEKAGKRIKKKHA